MSKVFSLILLFSIIIAADAATVTASFKVILTQRGLGHLSVKDMAKIEELLDGMNKATTTIHAEKAEAFDSIEEYMRKQGFEPDRVFVTRCHDKEALVVGKTFPQVTTEIPISLKISSLRNGAYFVRSGSMGVEQIIADGEVHNFRFSTWKSFYSCR